ncbi:ABC transporter substrate-binding protein [Pseudonocardia nigra]|uniref:ABC transporter substrate-binding protein n=1 Tax=Pseudonocardia nigra TaxID=1921578 RepID=UPI001C5E98E2|nr:sugar ABC transporter substrate-binding protein [Pseudonocardia nigra]
MLRRIMVAAAAAALAVASLAGCGSGEGEGGSDGPVTLRFLSLAWQEESVAANRALVDQWNAEHPDVQVEYIQGDWGSVHDQLLTAFEGGDPADVIHYESAAIPSFAQRGYLADLTDLVPADMREGIDDAIWQTVTGDDGALYGVPFLLESQVVIANKTMLDEAGIPVPTPEDPWSWDEYQAAARQLTDADTFGAAWPLSNPTNAVMNLSLAFGGQFFYEVDSEQPQVRFTEAEGQVPSRIHEMLYTDRSAAPEALGMSSTDTLPGFFAGKYATVPGGIWLRQQMVQQAPEGFDWVTLPPLAGDGSQSQAANPQTLSVAAQSEHQQEAMQFIEFFLAPQNMATLAKGDWLIPTSEGAREQLLQTTGGEQGWDIAVASAEALTQAPFQEVDAYSEWKTRIATPAFQRFFADEISLQELGAQLEQGGKDVLSR